MKMMYLVLILLSAPARAEEPAPSVTVLKDRFIEAADAAQRTETLDQIAKTPPATARDVAGLFDLFSRFSDKYARDSVMSSLSLIAPGSPQLEPLFLTYLRQPEPEAQLFGINGAFRLRAKAALPMIRAIAERKAAATTDTNVMSDRNAWWAQYEAMSVLAQWEPEKSRAMIERKGQENAKVGALLGRYYWKETLPKLRAWSESGDVLAAERAALAVSAPIESADARATREPMLALMRDPKVDAEIRHHLALKIGASSTEEEAAELAREHDAASEADRLYWAAAAFSSRAHAVVPLLARYAARTQDKVMSRGALEQLTDMVGAAEAARLIDSEKKK